VPEEITPEIKELNDSMMSLIKKKVEAFNPYRRAKLLEEKANIAYLCGHQNIEIVGGQIVPIAALDKYYVTVRANKLLPAVRNDIAVASKSKPRLTLFPPVQTKTINQLLKYVRRFCPIYRG